MKNPKSRTDKVATDIYESSLGKACVRLGIPLRTAEHWCAAQEIAKGPQGWGLVAIACVALKKSKSKETKVDPRAVEKVKLDLDARRLDIEERRLKLDERRAKLIAVTIMDRLLDEISEPCIMALERVRNELTGGEKIANECSTFIRDRLRDLQRGHSNIPAAD